MKFFDRKENENEEDYNQRYNTFINTKQNYVTFSDDFEKFAEALILNKKSYYYNTFTRISLLNEYNRPSAAKEKISIHFNLLKLKNDNNNFEKEIN